MMNFEIAFWMVLGVIAAGFLGSCVLHLAYRQGRVEAVQELSVVQSVRSDVEEPEMVRLPLDVTSSIWLAKGSIRELKDSGSDTRVIIGNADHATATSRGSIDIVMLRGITADKVAWIIGWSDEEPEEAPAPVTTAEAVETEVTA